MRANPVDRIRWGSPVLDAWAESINKFDQAQAGVNAGLPRAGATQQSARQARNQHRMSGRPGVNERNCQVVDPTLFAPRVMLKAVSAL
jgi:hypothetical protein